MDESAERESTSVRPAGAADRWLLRVGTLGGLGYAPASGTVSVAAAGIPIHLLLVGAIKISTTAYLIFIGAFTLLAIYVADRVDRILREKDSAKNVIDELPGFFIALVGLPLTWQIVAAAFFLERAIDIAKVWPANWIERRLPGGWGVVLDDVVAGIYTLVIMHFAIWWQPGLMGVG